MVTRQEVLDYGFKAGIEKDIGEFLALEITGPGDRFATRLRWNGENEVIYIDRYKMSGIITITEEELEQNHNELHNGALENWKKFKETFSNAMGSFIGGS
ncbi:MAG: hypothetical protein ACOYEB_03670 [Enterococcus lemanii]|jgi:hypothetical protein